MKRLRTAALDHHHLPLSYSNCPADRLVLRIVLDQLTVLHQRILSEKVTASVDRFLSQRRIFIHSDRSHVVYNGAETCFGLAVGKFFAFQNEIAQNLFIVPPDVCRLCDEHDG